MHRRSLTLDVAIVTWKHDGIDRVAQMNLPHLHDVRYVVSWQSRQGRDDIPVSLTSRDDVEIHLFDADGVAANRNNALRHCRGDLILMADDDLSYSASGLMAVIETFTDNATVDLATFKYAGALKHYPATVTDLRFPLPRNYGVATFEIAVRRSKLQGLEFDESFGPGAAIWQAAEDEKFLYDARRRGLRCRFFPIEITSHLGMTTGDKPFTDKGVCAASGKMIRLEYPRSWVPRILLKSARQWRQGVNPAFSLYHLLRGALTKKPTAT